MLCQFNIFLLTVHSWSPVCARDTLKTTTNVFNDTFCTSCIYAYIIQHKYNYFCIRCEYSVIKNFTFYSEVF